MTTVAAGATGTFTFTSVSTVAITVTPGFRATVSVVSSAGVRVFSDTIGSTRSIGPFLVGAVLTVEAGGQAVDYTVSAFSQAVRMPNAESQHSPAYDAASLQVLTNSGVPGVIRTLSSATLIGDSKLALGAHISGVNTEQLSDSQVVWANDYLAQSGQQIDVLNYRAVAGKTVRQVIDEQLTAALADTTDILWVKCGANSLNISLGNLSVAATLTQMTELLDRAQASSKSLIIVESVDPVAQSGTTGLKTVAPMIPVYNMGLEALCHRYGKVVYVDTYSVKVDTTSTALNPVGGFVLAVDGIHDSTTGAQAGGRAVAKKLLSAATITSYKTAGSNILPAITGTGGTATVGGGAITGTPPVGWNVSVASGAAAVTITQDANNFPILTCTNAGGADSVVYLQIASTSSLNALLAAGDVLRGTIDFQLTGAANMLRGCSLVMQFNGTGTPAYYSGQEDVINEAAVTFPAANFGGRRVSPIATVPASNTTASFVIGLKLKASTGACVLTVTGASLVKLT